MKKLADQESPLLVDPINSEKMIMGVWNKYFAPKHKSVVDSLRAEIKTDLKLQTDLTKMFPGFTWQEFAYMPMKHSLQELHQIMAQLSTAGVSAKTSDAINLYMAQYKMMLDQLNGQASKAPARTKKPSISPKIRQLQQLLGVPETGSWDATSNTAFLSWLRAKGWDKYISGDKFTGNIDDAIRSMLVEKTSEQPEQDEPAAPGTMEHYMKGLEQRQSARLEILKKIGEDMPKKPLVLPPNAKKNNSFDASGGTYFVKVERSGKYYMFVPDPSAGMDPMTRSGDVYVVTKSLYDKYAHQIDLNIIEMAKKLPQIQFMGSVNSLTNMLNQLK